MTKINPPMIARCSRLVVNSLRAVSPLQPKGMPQECRQNRKSSEQSRAKTGANSRNDRKAAYELDGSGSQHP
jgi:hypothetical protein